MSNSNGVSTPKGSDSAVQDNYALVQIMIKSLIMITLIQITGWIMGIALFFICLKLMTTFLRKVYGLEELTTMDYIFLLDKDTSRANVVGNYKLLMFCRIIVNEKVQI